MLTEDYLLRQIALATALIARIAGLRSMRLFTQAHGELQQMLELVVGLKADLIDQMDDWSLIQSMTNGDRPDTDRLMITADLVRADAEVYETEGNLKECAWRYRRALVLYLEVVLDGGARQVPLPVEQIMVLAERWGGELPLEAQYNLYQVYDRWGKRDLAERAIRRMLEQTGGQEDLVAEYRAFQARGIGHNTGVSIE